MTRTLPVSSVTGTILSGIFGYHDAPARGEFLLWALVLGITLWMFLRPHAPVAAPKPAIAAASASRREV